MLHAARYTHAAGGLDRLLDVENGAQQDRFPGGTQQIAEAMAADLGDRVVLNAPVRRIERHGAGVTVVAGAHQAEVGFVVVAVPPAHRASIEFAPRCPANTGNSPTTGRRAGSARPTPPTRPRSGGTTGSPARRCPTRARCSSLSTSARTPTGRAS